MITVRELTWALKNVSQDAYIEGWRTAGEDGTFMIHAVVYDAKEKTVYLEDSTREVSVSQEVIFADAQARETEKD